MRYQRVGVVLFSLSLLLTLLPVSTATAVREGGKCEIRGQTAAVKGKDFVCRKQGKKSVWKLLPQKAKTSAKIPAETAQPKQSILERWSKTESAALKTSAFWRENLSTGSPATPITFFFTKNVPQKVITESRERMSDAVLQWERFYKLSRTKVYFDLGMYSDKEELCGPIQSRSKEFTKDWCLDQINTSHRRILYHAAGYGSEGGYRRILAPKLSPDASSSHFFAIEDEATFNTSSFYSRIQHEFFHQVQFDLVGNEYVRQLSCWFAEGSAEYFGLLAATARDPELFLRYRAAWISESRREIINDDFESWLKLSSVPRLPAPSDPNHPCNSPGGAIYKTGALVTEWMLGKIGIGGLVQLLRESEEIGWLKSFEKSIGKSLEASYPEIVSYLRKEYAIVDANPWIYLPNCSSYKSAQRGLCISNNILHPNPMP